MEHARNRLGLDDATHAEYGHDGTAIVTPLRCSIHGTDITVSFAADSRLAAVHGTASAVEAATCNYGLDAARPEIAESGGMRVAARDETGEVRAVELIDHPYFVATLYQPQLNPVQPHPVFVGLVRAIDPGGTP